MQTTTTSTANSDRELVLNNVYQVTKRKIGAGSFGTVYQTVNKNTGEIAAVKIEKNEDKDSCSILYEAACLSRLQGIKGFPKLHWSGSTEKYDAMVISLLGRDIGSYVKIFKKFSLKTVVCLMDQLISLLQHMHNRNLIHRDIKPENMALGRGDQNGFVHLLDFGISKVYKDDNGRHIPFREGKPFIGTTRYASVAAHRGIEISRKDDLESLGFVSVFLLKGVLPWQNLNVSEKEKNKKVGDMKQSLTPDKLCDDLPEEFKHYFNYLKSLKFSEEPDYNFLRRLLLDISKAHKFTIDSEFDWSRPLKLAVKPQRSDAKKNTFTPNLGGSNNLHSQLNDDEINLGSSLLKPPSRRMEKNPSLISISKPEGTNLGSIWNGGGTRVAKDYDPSINQEEEFDYKSNESPIITVEFTDIEEDLLPEFKLKGIEKFFISQFSSQILNLRINSPFGSKRPEN